jgi:hypothetical protein
MHGRKGRDTVGSCLWLDPVSVEEALQNENGGYLVDDGTMLGAGASGVEEMPVGFGGGQALVPEVDWQASFVAENLGKGLRLGGLRALISGHVKRIADDDLVAVVFTDEASKGFEVLSAVGAREGEDGLGSQAERIGDGDTDAAISNVEAHESGNGGWGELVHGNDGTGENDGAGVTAAGPIT